MYGHAAVEITAYILCIKQMEHEVVDFDKFWKLLETEQLYFEDLEAEG